MAGLGLNHSGGPASKDISRMDLIIRWEAEEGSADFFRSNPYTPIYTCLTSYGRISALSSFTGAGMEPDPGYDFGGLKSNLHGLALRQN
jgi:hypothetical protein